MDYAQFPLKCDLAVPPSLALLALRKGTAGCRDPICIDCRAGWLSDRSFIQGDLCFKLAVSPADLYTDWLLWARVSVGLVFVCVFMEGGHRGVICTAVYPAHMLSVWLVHVYLQALRGGGFFFYIEETTNSVGVQTCLVDKAHTSALANSFSSSLLLSLPPVFARVGGNELRMSSRERAWSCGWAL